jgi:type III restriction enzyme
MQLKTYQENAIDDLLTKTKRLLSYSGGKKLVFKAPTGSGKTIMMAEFLKQLVDDREIKQSLSFIWTAPRPVLTLQSKEKLENYFENSRALKCSFFEDLKDRKIGENEILFFNWEKVRREDLIYIRDNEQENNLPVVFARTKEEGREIILIIDESHYQAQSDAAQKWIKDVGPKLVIEVSATPKAVEQPDETVNVHIEDVKKEGMIKRAVILNDKFVNLLRKGKIESSLSKSSDELVIDAALKKREELSKAFQKEGVKINPLVLIQLPDRMGQREDDQKDLVIRILKDKYNISTENGKLAIWLSGEHINKENVEKHDSEVEVLIFKQAIALGWDCPRAQILVLFREWHSPIFSIQTVGRIMRMPEPDKGYYKNDILNYGYIYTNLSDIEIQEDIAGGYLTIYTSKRREDYKPINLLFCHSERHREKTRLSPLFIEIFLKEAKNYGLKRNVKIKERKLDLKVFSDWRAEDIDAWAGKIIHGDKAIEISGIDLQRLFDFFVRKSLREGAVSLYPEDRSVGRVKDAIHRFLGKELKIEYGTGMDIVLSEKNIQHFINVIDRAKEGYQKEVLKREPVLEFVQKWNVPEMINFGENAVKEERKKSIMQPFYRIGEWKTEAAFIEFLEKSEAIEWWFKNGDREVKFFAVPYENGEPKPFYVDFIVQMKDGRIGLFDPHGTFLSDFGAKADGLYKYIQNENKKGKKLFGGIVANTDQRKYKGRWIYFDKTSKELKNDFSNWKDLEF